MSNKKPLPSNEKGDLDNLLNRLKKTVKDKSKSPFLSLGDLDEKFSTRFYIPSGMPSLDLYLYHKNDKLSKVDSYGIASGRMVEFYGPSKSFKTYFAHLFSASCLKMDGYVFFFYTEKDIDINFMRKVYSDSGVDMSIYEEHVIASVIDTVKELKEQCQIIVDTIKNLRKETGKEFPVLIILDSYAMLFGDQELKNYEQADFETSENSGNHLTKNKEAVDFYRYINKDLAENNITFMFTNQVRANIKKRKNTQYLPDKVPVNNDTLEFFSSLRVSTERAYVPKINPNSQEILGYDVYLTITKFRSDLYNKGRLKLFYRQNYGFDYFSSLLDAMFLSGLIFFSDSENRSIRFCEEIEIYEEEIGELYKKLMTGKKVSFDKKDFKSNFLTCIKTDEEFLGRCLDIVFNRGIKQSEDTREIIW